MHMKALMEEIDGKVAELVNLAGDTEVAVWSQLRLAGKDPSPDLWQLYRQIIKINGALHLARTQSSDLPLIANRLETESKGD